VGIERRRSCRFPRCPCICGRRLSPRRQNVLLAITDRLHQVPGCRAQPIRGFSTITSTARRATCSRISIRAGERTLGAQAEGSARRRGVEAHVPQDTILELYFNQISLGPTWPGWRRPRRCSSASRRVIERAEAATLAALPKAPGNYNPAHPDRAVGARNVVLTLCGTRATSPEDAEYWKA